MDEVHAGQAEQGAVTVLEELLEENARFRLKISALEKEVKLLWRGREELWTQLDRQLEARYECIKQLRKLEGSNNGRVS